MLWQNCWATNFVDFIYERSSKWANRRVGAITCLTAPVFARGGSFLFTESDFNSI